MNLVEIYLKEIYEEKPFNFKSKKFPNIKFIKVTATWEYYGKTEKKTKVFDIDRWNKIKKRRILFRIKGDNDDRKRKNK